MANSNFRTIRADYIDGVTTFRNYFKNSVALQGTTGWTTYADTAGTQPIDGSGGVPNVVWEISSSSPLRGDTSFVFTKDAANRQGEGVSYSFDIDSADQGKQQQITFDYSIVSGTYVTGDLTVYIIHDPNGTPKVIQPSGFKIENVGIASVARLTFQTEVSAQSDYRICFHVATTSAVAYSLKFDNFILGPQVIPLGTVITNWETVSSYTLNNVTLGTGGFSFLKRRRVGDSADYIGGLNLGTGGSFTGIAGFGLGGLSVDLSKLADADDNDVPRGTAIFLDTSTAFLYSATAEYTSARNQIEFTSSITPGTVNGTNPFTWAVGDTLEFHISGLPIQGWDANTIVSSSANTRIVSLRAYGNPTSTLTAGTWTDIYFGSASDIKQDTHASMNFATGVATIKVPGTYTWQAGVEVSRTSGSVGGATIVRALVNGVDAYYGSRVPWVSTGAEASGASGAGSFPVKAGDTVKFQVFATATAGLAWSAATTGTSIAFQMLNGPSQIAATETISLSVTKNSGSHTISGSVQTIASWNTAEKDSHNAFNITTGIWTCPAPGDYFISGTFGWITGGSGTRQLIINKNNSATYVSYSPIASDTDAYATTSRLLTLTTGDTIRLGAFQNSGGALNYSTTANTTHLSILRVGGTL